MFKIVKVIFINLSVLFGLLGIITVGPLIAQVSFDAIQRFNPWEENRVQLAKNTKIDNRPKLTVYDDVDWAEEYFSERLNVPIDYKDFITWRKGAHRSRTINIDENGIRRTVPKNENSPNEIWLFGGSTVWGNGVDDSNTIASHLAKISGAKVINFGEDGYISRQSLNMLIKAYNRKKSEKNISVIFYEGANDGAGHCVAGETYIHTDREYQIQAKMKNLRTENVIDFKSTFRNTLLFLNKLKYKLGVHQVRTKETFWNCDKSPARAEFIANALVNDWTYAQKITETNGDFFLAILQPVLHLSKTEHAHLKGIKSGPFDPSGIFEIIKKQFSTVYPKIRESVALSDIRFLDFSPVLDINEPIYIDPLHLSHYGNSLIAREMYKKLKDFGRLQ